MDFGSVKCEPNMFNKGQDGHRWPTSLFGNVSSNHLTAGKPAWTGLPNLLRLNSTGESSPEEESRSVPQFSNLTKKRAFVDGMQSNVQGVHNWTGTNPPQENAYNFSLARRTFSPVTFCTPVDPSQPGGQTTWTAPHWFLNGSFVGNPWSVNAIPMTGLNYFYHGWPLFMKSHAATQRSHPTPTPNNRTSNSSSFSPKQGTSSGANGTRTMAADLDVVSQNFSSLRISSERSDSSKRSQTGGASGSGMQMHIDISISTEGHGTQNSESAVKHTGECSNAGNHKGNGARRSAASVCVDTENKKNLAKSATYKSKNGYHEPKTNGNATAQQRKESDEISPHLPSDSSQSEVGSKPRSKPSVEELSRVLFDRVPSTPAKYKRCRPSAKKRLRIKERCQNSEQIWAQQRRCRNKKLKVNHRDIPTDVNEQAAKPCTSDTPTESCADSSTSSVCSTFADICGFSSKSDDKGQPSVPKDLPVSPDSKQSKLWYTSSSDSDDDTNFDDDEENGEEVLSESEADIWNSFNTFNPCDFSSSATTTSASAPVGIPKSNSAPALFSPEPDSNDDDWRPDFPVCTPPKRDALTRVAKKVP